jgi:hypothetical protein
METAPFSQMQYSVQEKDTTSRKLAYIRVTYFSDNSGNKVSELDNIPYEVAGFSGF